MKDMHIKIWPEIDGYIPAIVPWQNLSKKGHSILIDFTDCSKVSSSSLSQLLVRIIKLIDSDSIKRRWKSHDKIINTTFGKIIKLNFFNILENYSPEESLFSDKAFSNFNSSVLIENDIFGNKIYSFPIYCINCNKYSDRREVLNDFRGWIKSILKPFYQEYDFNLSQIVLILNEIAKNTADHTEGNGFIGIDIKKSSNSEVIQIEFSIGDLGLGINKNIKENLPVKLINRYEYWDLTQTYMYALRDRSTTKLESGFNKGVGMTIILQGARQIEMELSVFDAKSRGILTRIKSLTHSNVRENFFNIGKPVGFYYSGLIVAKRINQ